jgi:hypothetical protein
MQKNNAKDEKRIKNIYFITIFLRKLFFMFLIKNQIMLLLFVLSRLLFFQYFLNLALIS